MLGGKDFRRRQERTLIARIDHLQHREDGDDGLTGPHLALQHAVHRPTRRQLGRQHVEDILLPCGQFERQLLTHCRDQTVVLHRGDGTGPLSVPRIAAPPTPIAGRRPRHRSAARRRHRVPPPSLRCVSPAVPGLHRSDCVAAETIPAVAPRPGRARRAPGAHTRRCPRSAASCWRGRSGRSPAGTPPADPRRLDPDASGNRLQRLRPLHLAALVQHEERRMGQLQSALEVADLPGQHHPCALFQGLLEVLHVEERRRHLRRPVTERDDHVLTLRGERFVHFSSALLMTSTNVMCSPSSGWSPSSSTDIPSLYLRG